MPRVSEISSPGPDVTVLMTVYNGMPYFESALNSICTQTLKNIEIIVVDDASTDDTPVVLDKFAAKDGRIRIHRLENNSGIAAAANAGVTMARAPLLARMDADDIALPERLAKQKAVMDASPELVLLGTSIFKIDAAGSVTEHTYRPRDHVQVAWVSLFHMPLNNPSTMIRLTDTVSQNLFYDHDSVPAEDYELSSRLLQFGQGANMGERLLKYRSHPTQITQVKYMRQAKVAARVARQNQARDLPAELCTELESFNAAFLEFKPTPAREIFAGLRSLISYSSALNPQHSTFFRRYGAQLAATALRRSNNTLPNLSKKFIVNGQDFVAPLVSRFLETKGLLR